MFGIVELSVEQMCDEAQSTVGCRRLYTQRLLRLLTFHMTLRNPYVTGNIHSQGRQLRCCGLRQPNMSSHAASMGVDPSQQPQAATIGQISTYSGTEWMAFSAAPWHSRHFNGRRMAHGCIWSASRELDCPARADDPADVCWRAAGSTTKSRNT